MLIDSNILVYSINLSSPKHKKAQDFIRENLSELIVAHQNIFETLRVLTHPKFPNPMKIDDAYFVATALGNGIGIIATDNTQDFKRFIELKTINPF